MHVLNRDGPFSGRLFHVCSWRGQPYHDTGAGQRARVLLLTRFLIRGETSLGTVVVVPLRDVRAIPREQALQLTVERGGARQCVFTALGGGRGIGSIWTGFDDML